MTGILQGQAAEGFFQPPGFSTVSEGRAEPSEEALPSVKKQLFEQPLGLPKLNSEVINIRSEDAGFESLVLPISVNGSLTFALIDLGAQVTVLSQQFWEGLNSKPRLERSVKMRGAGKDSHMKGGKAGKVTIEISRGNLMIGPHMLHQFQKMFYRGWIFYVLLVQKLTCPQRRLK